MTARLNEKRREVTLAPRQLVFEWELVGQSGLSTKISKQWKGPFVVENQTSPVNYKIRGIKSKKVARTVHVRRLEPFIVRDDEEGDNFWNKCSEQKFNWNFRFMLKTLKISQPQIFLKLLLITVLHNSQTGEIELKDSDCSQVAMASDSNDTVEANSTRKPVQNRRPPVRYIEIIVC